MLENDAKRIFERDEAGHVISLIRLLSILGKDGRPLKIAENFVEIINKSSDV